MKKKYMVVHVQAYVSESPEGSLSDVTNLELIEDDPNLAIERAKKLVNKKFYRIARIFEGYTP